MKYPDDFINQIIQGDCMEVMKEIPDNSIDTIITDPPYFLSFMGKDWDTADKEKMYEFNYNWAKEALRIAKPGATLLCFGGTRTFHRLACAIEDAGWIIKDCIMWIYGSGFPKSADISKQIAKKQGAKKQETKKRGAGSKGNTFPLNKEYQDYELTPEAKLWNGWQSHGLKPAYEPIIVAMKPNDGSYTENALKWGVAGLNIDGGRIAVNMEKEPRDYWSEPRAKDPNYTIKPSGYIFPKKISYFSSSLSKEKEKGRYPANVILDEEAAEELDKQSGVSKSNIRKPTFKKYNAVNTWACGKDETIRGHNDIGGASRFFEVIEDDFPTFIYCPKASRSERNMGCEKLEDKPAGQSMKNDKYTREKMGNTPADKREPIKNNHPTVKPLKLMEYLCILTKTPTGGIILDPFAGSGTTCMAAKKTGRDFIGIEKEEEYCKIARARINAIVVDNTLPIENTKEEK